MVTTRSNTTEESERKQHNFRLESERLGSIEWPNTQDYKEVKPVVYQPIEFVMETKLINTILSNDLDKWPKFSGKRDENVNKWVTDITHELNMVKLSDGQKRSVIQTFLLDDARRWFINNMVDMPDWDSFVTSIQKTFSSTWLQELAIQKVGSRQQGGAETILHYYNEMMELFDTIDFKMADNLKVIYLTTGLKSSIKKEVLRRNPKTPVEFLDTAQAEEKLDFTSMSYECHDEAPNGNSLAVLRTYGQQSNSYIQPQRRRQSTSTFRCYRCQKVGHIARNCFAKNY